MKKSMMIAVATLAMGALFTSCKKDHSCECTYKDASGATQVAGTGSFKASKSSAKKSCEALNTTYAQFTGVECKLK